jgi:hypothetical protein
VPFDVGLGTHPGCLESLQRPLGGQGGLKCGGCGRECGAELVPHRLEDVAAVGRDRLAQEGIVAGEGVSHRLGLLLPELGASLNVGEQESQRILRSPGREPPARLLAHERGESGLGAAAGLRPQLLEERGGLGIRVGAQLPAQSLAQLAVGLQRGRVVAAGREGLHQGAVGALPQGIERDRPPQVALGRSRIARRQGVGSEGFQCPENRLLAGLTLGEDPLLEARFQQRAPVEGHRLLQGGGVAAGHRGVEPEHVRLSPGQVERQEAGGAAGSLVRAAQAAGFRTERPS